MALVVADRVWETTSTSGTGTLTLSGALSGYQSFAIIGDGNTTYYTIVSGDDWEVGIGTYTSSGTTLSRDTVLSSSLGGTTKISVIPGSFVFVDYPAGRAVYEDESGVVSGYPISGGSINNTPIGATTPSTVNATTITGQTGVLNGTGSNLFTQSQDYTPAAWSKAGSTITAASIIAPNGTLTGQTLNEDTSTGQHNISRGGGSEVLSVGATYTMSVFAKQAGRSVIFIQALGTFTKSYFDIAGGTVLSSGAGMTSTITSVGDGWFRCTVTFTCDTTNNAVRVIAATTGNGVQTYTGTGIASVYLWGAQMEFGSTANTYIPTTTTAVYGTPTLSFSGVSSIGLLSNGALYLQPAGTGALQAQATTSTTAGGNARGANAVDWQTSRTNAAQVASGSFSVIGGGNNNNNSGFGGVICGGTGGTIGTYGVIGGGFGNSATGPYSAVAGGYSNTANGFYNFIGNGFTNSGTASTAVTTQATTAVTSGSTAVTLSGSNANIKVGQLITGTGINSNPNTYVAAISGTSLTLSQNATATGTPTLSFFTPHGVVVGGGNNQATGSYSFIGGGGDAGTAANRNVASGDWSFVGGGIKNVASGIASVVAGGGFDGTIALQNTASGIGSVVLGGASNVASSSFTIAGGRDSTASGNRSTALGNHATTRGIAGNVAFSGSANPIAGLNGVSQSALLVLARQTTDATPTALTSDSNAAGTTNQVILPNNSAYFFRGEVISGKTAAGDTKGWTIEGVIKRGANAASTALVGIPTVTSTYADLGAATWDIAVTADTTNGGIRVTFTGQAATTIRTVCQIRTTEMTF
jgi:hypothetical protein